MYLIGGNMNSKVENGKSDGKALEIHLQKINKLCINLEDNEKRLFTQHFHNVYKYVTDSMGATDDLFCTKVFQRQQLAGSYADGIKVGKPNEYDALMILKFPDPIVTKSRPNFVKINIRDGIVKKWSTVDEKSYKTLIDKNGYLLQDKVLIWLRGLIYDVVNKCNGVIRIGENEYYVKKSSSGPAVTLDITISKCADGTRGNFSIDFVSALAFDFKEHWFADFKPPIIKSKNWNAVAKPIKSKPNQNQEWICSYADIEREYLQGTNTLKQLIRIFKTIRDTHNLTNLKSYYIKVIFLQQRRKQITNNNYWNQSLGTLFLEMFDIILKHLEKRTLISFWHSQYNLFGELTQIQLTDIYNKLKKIKDTIDKNLINKTTDPDFIFTAILSKDEVKRFSSGHPNCASTSQNSCKVDENKSYIISQRMQTMLLTKL